MAARKTTFKVSVEDSYVEEKSIGGRGRGGEK